MWSRSFIGAAAIVACVVASAQGQVFYGVTPTNLVKYDMAAHTVTDIGPVHVGPNAMDSLQDCDFDAAGNLYVMRQGVSGPFFPPPAVNQGLRILNKTTASAVQTTDFGNGLMQSMAYDPAAGSFYSVNQLNVGGIGGGNLIHADMNTGVLTSVANTSHNLPGPWRVEAVATAPNGKLYGLWDGGIAIFGIIDYKLITIDTVTGQGSIVGTVGTGSQAFNALRFDNLGNAYTVDYYTGDVFTIDLATGHGNFLFAGGSAALNTTGLAFVVPTPGALAVLAASGLTAARRRRRA